MIHGSGMIPAERKDPTMKVSDSSQPMQRLISLRELGRLHLVRRRLVAVLDQIRRDGVPNGCGLIAKRDALQNTERQIAIQRSFLYS